MFGLRRGVLHLGIMGLGIENFCWVASLIDDDGVCVCMCVYIYIYIYIYIFIFIYLFIYLIVLIAAQPGWHFPQRYLGCAEVLDCSTRLPLGIRLEISEIDLGFRV